MGNASAHAFTASGQQQVGDLRGRLQEDLPKLIYVERLSNGKFIKSFKCKVDGVGVVVKVYVRRDPDEDLSPVVADLMRIAAALHPESHPHALPYQRWLLPQAAAARQAARPAYLIRQHVLANLYDRLSTRPFLAPVERRWMAYQLLRALAQCHAAGVCHGDIKSENVLVTSWNWVLLCDLAPFKPTYVPDDQPAEVDYYFHARERRRCYLAPERLYSPAQQERAAAAAAAASAAQQGGGGAGGAGALDSLLDSRMQASISLEASVLSPGGGGARRSSLSPATTCRGSPAVAAGLRRRGTEDRRTGPLQPAMDVFSLGCVIAEMFLDGEAPLDLPDLLEYRAAADPAACLRGLAKVEDVTVQRLVRHMLQRDPARRRTAQEYLERMEKDEVLFPAYFKGFLYDVMAQLHTRARTPDQRILLLCSCYEQAMLQLAGVHDPVGARVFRSCMEGAAAGPTRADAAPAAGQRDASPASPPPRPARGRSAAGAGMGPAEGVEDLLERTRALIADLDPSWRSDARSSAPETPGRGAAAAAPSPPAAAAAAAAAGPALASADGSGLVILAQAVCASLRHLRRAGTRLLALNLLVRFGQHCGDEARLQRLVPNIVPLLEDPVPSVRACAVRGLSLLLAMVTSFPPSDANIFTLYIFPALQRLPQDSEEMVRAAFAEALPSLAETSKRFLDIAHAARQAKAMARQAVSLSPAPRAPGGAAAGPVTAPQQPPVQGDDPPQALEAKTTAGGLDRVVLVDAGYDRELGALRGQVSRWLVLLASPPASPPQASDADRGGAGRDALDSGSSAGAAPRLALAGGVARLCGFFGQEGTLSTLLPQLITFLNDRLSWALRAAFCRHAPAVCAFVGKVATAKFVLPCIENALADAEEAVVAGALRCLAALVELGLLATHAQLDAARAATPLLHHPSLWIREAAIALSAAIARALGPVDAAVFLLPALRPFLRFSLLGAEPTPSALRRALVPPPSRGALQAYVAELRGSGSSGGRGGPDPADVGLRSVDLALSDSAVDFCFCDDVFDDIDGVGGINASQPGPGGSAAMVAAGASAAALARRAAAGGSGGAAPSAVVAAGAAPAAVPQQHALTPLERRQLEAMRPYVEAAARSQLGGGAGARGRKGSGLGGSALRLYGQSLPERLALALFVPHQRYAPPRPTPEGDARPSPPRVSGSCGGTAGWTDPEAMAAETGLRTSSSHAARLSSTAAGGGAYGAAAAEEEDLYGVSDLASEQSAWSLQGTGMAAEAEGQTERLLGGVEPQALLARARAVGVPPLPPDLGRAFSLHEAWGGGASGQADWRPKQGGLVTSLREHTAAVNRIVVAQDNVFFATASSDGTCKVWELRGLEQSIRPRSHVTYAQQGAPLLDACIVEGSHSIATAASNGSVHVWRVELASTSSNIGSAAPHLANGGTMGGPGVGGGGGLRVAGSSLVKQVAAGEGPVLSVHHFNTDLASVVVYSTQRGRIHAWDLRCSREPWRLAAPPELGALTAVALGPDRHWVCAGTARGYLAMWDVRFPLLARLWRHSARGPIHRLSTCARLPGDTSAAAPKPEAGGAGPHVFIAAGDDETAVWDLRGAGTLRPRHCFRVAPTGFDGQQAPVPSLDSIALPAHPRAPLLPMHAAFADARLGGNVDTASAEQLRGTSSIRAIVGRISQHGNSYLITGGSDRHIRYWDFQVPSRCYTVSGGSPSPLPASMMPSVECYRSHGGGAGGAAAAVGGRGAAASDGGAGEACMVTVFRTPPNPQDFMQAHLAPVVAECGVTAAPTAHEDAILDLKCTDMPLKLLLSSSRDGVVNVWR